MPHQNLYPLKLAPNLKDKIWGGRQLNRMYRVEDERRHIGEAWLADENNRVVNGAYSGRLLNDVMLDSPTGMLGSRNLALSGSSFPLLVKFLDAADVLSVQVHPDDGYARKREGQRFGKCEVWYILEAAPGAKIIHGFKQPMSREELRRVIAEGRLMEAMEEVEVRAGDIVLNTPGTVHALGAGILVYELQQSSDLTYRLFDWNRKAEGAPRPLHIDQSVDVADLAPFSEHKIQPVVLETRAVKRTFLAACRYFAAELLRVARRADENTGGASFHAITALSGKGQLSGAGQPPVALNAGETILAPAGLGEYCIETVGDPLTAIKAYVPDLPADIVQPLKQGGIPLRRIVQLGGDPARSDLRQYAD